MSPALRPLRKREEMPDFVREALERTGLRAAYDARGVLLGAHPLLPPPADLRISRDGGQRLDFTPIPQAAAYAIRVTLDADGTRLESSQRVAGPGALRN